MHWLDLTERFIRLSLGFAAAVNELFFRAEAQPSVLLFIAGCIGLPEAIRMIRPASGEK